MPRYPIRRAEKDALYNWVAWQITTTESELSINDLERGVEYDFRVSGVNAAGAGMASNVVTVVL